MECYDVECRNRMRKIFLIFAAKVPAIFFFVGGLPPGNDPKLAPPHHTPDFYVDEEGMKTGIKSFCIPGNRLYECKFQSRI